MDDDGEQLTGEVESTEYHGAANGRRKETFGQGHAELTTLAFGLEFAVDRDVSGHANQRQDGRTGAGECEDAQKQSQRTIVIVVRVLS